MQITDRVYLVGSGESGIYLTNRLDCNCYLVDCGQGYTLIDTGIGPNSAEISNEIDALLCANKPLLAILLTHGHGDHVGGAAALRKKYAVAVYAPRAEAEIISSGDEQQSGLEIVRKAGYYPADYHLAPCTVDRELEVAEVFQIGDVTWHAFEASGHSIGGLCYLAEVAGLRLLFAGDLVAYGGKISLQNIPGSSVLNYARCIDALSGLAIDQLYPGHGLFSLREGQRHIDRVNTQFKQLYVPV